VCLSAPVTVSLYQDSQVLYATTGPPYKPSMLQYGGNRVCIDLNTERREMEKDANYMRENCAPYYQLG
jgi:hypothetical protein